MILNLINNKCVEANSDNGRLAWKTTALRALLEVA
jgi:hypothetical protein